MYFNHIQLKDNNTRFGRKMCTPKIQDIFTHTQNDLIGSFFISLEVHAVVVVYFISFINSLYLLYCVFVVYGCHIQRH